MSDGEEDSDVSSGEDDISDVPAGCSVLDQIPEFISEAPEDPIAEAPKEPEGENVDTAHKDGTKLDYGDGEECEEDVGAEDGEDYEGKEGIEDGEGYEQEGGGGDTEDGEEYEDQEGTENKDYYEEEKKGGGAEDGEYEDDEGIEDGEEYLDEEVTKNGEYDYCLPMVANVYSLSTLNTEETESQTSPLNQKTSSLKTKKETSPGFLELKTHKKKKKTERGEKKSKGTTKSSRHPPSETKVSQIKGKLLNPTPAKPTVDTKEKCCKLCKAMFDSNLKFGQHMAKHVTKCLLCDQELNVKKLR